MKEKILLDTNMLIYLLDNQVLDDKVARITKALYDSDKYSIVIHPKTLVETDKIKDEKRKSIFKSKLNVYNIIDNPPKITDEFNNLAGLKNEHDKIDNEMLYAVYRNCVTFLITNDKELVKKGKKLNLGDRVLSIDNAYARFKEEEKVIVQTPVFIKQEYLYNLDLEDEFFSSLRMDYKGFDVWFKKKQLNNAQAYITQNQQNKVTSFLMLKEEGKDEDYSSFDTPFKPAKRLKVATFKVADTGKKIGECFIKIMIKEAIKKNIDEIYVTTFERQASLIYLLKQYGFKFATYKNTPKSDNTIEKEAIFVKNIKDKKGYPFVQLDNQNIFIIPIQPKYHKLLFEEAEREFQISIDDTQGINTSANAIKKAFITNSKIKMIKPNDILLFYASQDKKAITTLGIVETTWNKFETREEIFNIVRKRTAYNEIELMSETSLDSLVIMFKHYITFNKPITYKFLLENGIINGPIQGPMSIKKEMLKKVIIEGNSKEMFSIQ